MQLDIWNLLLVGLYTLFNNLRFSIWFDANVILWYRKQFFIFHCFVLNRVYKYSEIQATDVVFSWLLWSIHGSVLILLPGYFYGIMGTNSPSILFFYRFYVYTSYSPITWSPSPLSRELVATRVACTDKPCTKTSNWPSTTRETVCVNLTL